MKHELETRINRWMDRWMMTWGLDGEDLVINFGDRRRWIGKAIPLFRTCRGQTTILEDADVTYRMKPMDESMDDLMDTRGSMDEITPETAEADGEETKPK